MYLNVKKLGASCCLAVLGAGLCFAADGDLRLIDAVRNRDPKLVGELLEQGADVNGPQGDGATALHWAARIDDSSIAGMLIRAGANAAAANDNGATPLHLACINRSAAMVEQLLAAGADANAKLLNGETVLMTCSRAGNVQAVEALLAHGAKMNEKETGHGQTALMWAVANSRPQIVRLLLKAGADFRARSLTYPQTVVDEATQRAGREELNYTVMKGGMTALLFAARNGNVESAELLLEAGADSNETLPNGASALVLAAHSGQGDVGIALLAKGADPNSFGTGYTALHAAVLRSQLELVKSLLAHGADPNVRMTKATPLRRASTDFNLPEPLIGSTPYFLAAKFVEADILRALAAGGADITLGMSDGTTPLMAAAGMGSRGRGNRRGISGIDVGGTPEPESQVLAAVQAAVELGGEVNARNEDGDTALHAAASAEFDSVVQFLADSGAEINAKNNRGQTPLAALLRPVGRFGRGRRRPPALDADPSDDSPRAALVSSTIELLRKLGGATE